MSERIYIPPKHRRRRSELLDDYRPDLMLGRVLLGIVAALMGLAVWWLFHR